MSTRIAKSISRSSVEIVLSVGVFSTPSHNSQSGAISKSLQLFMRWEKPSSRWKTTRHLELMESLLKSSNRRRKMHTMAPRSHLEAWEWWGNSRWHQWGCNCYHFKARTQRELEKRTPSLFPLCRVIAEGIQATFWKAINMSKMFILTSVVWWDIFFPFL